MTKHANFLEVSRQKALSGNSQRQIILTTQAADRKMRGLNGGDHRIINNLVTMDGDEHHKYRRLAQAWFLPQNRRKLEDRIR